jgi:hypothetical protein
MKSIATIEGVITKLNKAVYLEDGHVVRNLVICCELANKNKSLVFHDVILWNDLAEIELKKNISIRLIGELKYKNKDGNKYAEIIAKEIEIL